ncbi:MAG: hypothetical protein HY821_08565 [Acidobacteria bacterium]|nr:hypothetical protein [Acidobacteriota bacterium]
MRRTTVLALAMWMGLAAWGQEDWSDEKKAEFLKKAEVKASHSAPDGITGTTKATLSDGTVSHAVSIQTIDVTALTPSGNSPPEPGFTDRYVYNMAAYELNRILKLNMVPVTVIRAFEGRNGSYTWWVDEAMMTEKQRFYKKTQPVDNTAWNDQMFIVRVFDQLIYNMDRNLGNLVIDRDWKLWMIDHSRAFRIWKQLKEKKNLVKCDRVLLERLRNLDEAELHAKLGEYLAKAQVEAIKARAELIVKEFDAKIKKKGEREVLYDYLKAK